MELPARQFEAASHEKDDLAEATIAHAMKSRSVQELAVHAQSGCAVAFAELHDRLHPRLIRFLDKRLFSTSVLAEDVAAEALTKAWQAIDSYDPKYQFLTWVYSIATRKATDHLRAAKRKRLGPLPPDVPSHTRTPAATLEDAEAIGTIWSVAQHRLSDDQYAAVWLRFGEDLSITEVAKALGKTTVGVRVLLHRGRAALQRALADDHGLPASAAASEQEKQETKIAQENLNVNKRDRAINGGSSADAKREDQQKRDQS